jgi:hypothetical protein
MSVVIMSVAPTAVVHALILFYKNGAVLYDVVGYKNKKYNRINHSGHAVEKIDHVGRFILEELPKRNSYIRHKIEEEMGSDCAIKTKEQDIQRLKDRIRILQDTNGSLHNQIKSLKAKN